MYLSELDLARGMGPIHQQKHAKLVKLLGKSCNWEDDGGGGGDVVDHCEPDPGVPLADLHHLLHNLLLAADREPDGWKSCQMEFSLSVGDQSSDGPVQCDMCWVEKISQPKI